MKKYISTIICFVLLFGVQNIPVFAESISGVTASIDAGKQVTVGGNLNTGAGRLVNVRIVDPAGVLEYAGSQVSASYGSFLFSYTMTNNTAGRYTVSVSALGIAAPVGTYFDYGTNNNLSALSISNGAFDRVFSPDITQYAVTVDNRITRLTVTPTVSDGTAVVKVNNTVVSSGIQSNAIALNEGTNSINVTVTALDGKIKTYLITVTRQNVLNASLSVIASITAGRQVTVSGTVSSGAGQLVSMRIIAPDSSTEYAGMTTSKSGGAFQFIYNMIGTLKGKFTAFIGALGVAQPVTSYFNYGNDADLKSLSVNNGSLKPAFDPGVASYVIDIGSDINSMTITPTGNDARALISVNGAGVSSGASSIIALKSGVNSINIIVTAQDGVTKKTYTVMVYKAVPLPAGVSVRAEINREKLVTVSGSVVNTAGQQVSVMITDPNGKPEYLSSAVSAGGAFSFSYTTTNITRGRYYVSIGALGLASPALTYFIYDPANADLKDLSISGITLSPAFSPGTTGYSASAAYGTSTVKVTPKTLDSYASVQVNGSTVASGGTSGDIALSTGDNTVRVIVTAQDGTKKLYEVRISRAYLPPQTSSSPPPAVSDNADLSSLTISTGTLTPEFVPGTTSYAVSYVNSVNTVTVATTVAESHATVTVSGAAVTSGTTSDAIALSEGVNVIPIVVTAQNGTTKTYTITATRAAAVSNDATLQSLSAYDQFSESKTSIITNFASTTTEYVITPGQGGVYINAVVHNPDATMKVTVKNLISGGTITTPEADLFSGVEKLMGVNSADGTEIIIVVTAQDGVTQKTYKITIPI